MDAIVLTPDQGGETLQLELRGNLAAMLGATVQTKRSPESDDLSLQGSIGCRGAQPSGLRLEAAPRQSGSCDMVSATRHAESRTRGADRRRIRGAPPPEHRSGRWATSWRAPSVTTSPRRSPGCLRFPDSKVSLFFPPHAVLLCILLLVPTRHWWAYVLGAASAHFLATQQAHWPPVYTLTGEAFDAVKCVAAAAGIRMLITSPLTAITLRDAILFVLIAVVLVPFGTAFWGASFTVSYGFGTRYWIEWRNLGVSNAVTTVVLVPAFLLGAHHLFVRRPRALAPRRVLEAALVGACTVALGIFVFDQTPAGPNASPALLYAPIPLLIWAALRFGLGGISVSMLIITFLAIWGTMRGHGPFLAQTPAENALALQLFLLVTATPLMLLAVVIEEERRSKEALRESANLMGLAAEAGNLAMWVWDVSRNDVWMTGRGRSLFGLEPDAALDFAATFDLVHPEDRTAREGAITQALRTRGEYDVEYRVQQADGTARWIHGRGRCGGPDDGTGPKLFGVSMDVTARKQAEASAAQKRAELEHVARVATLGELTTTLTHELKQPLAAILTNSYVGMRLLEADKPDLQSLRSALADICDVTERAGEVISGLRAMLKRDTTATGLTDVDVNDVIRIIERIAHGDAVGHKVAVHLDLSPEVSSAPASSGPRAAIAPRVPTRARSIASAPARTTTR